MSKWRFIVCERDGAEIGELWNAADRDISLPLIGGKGGGTLATSIALDHPLADPIIGDPADQSTRINKLLKAYRDDELMLNADLFAGEESGDGNAERLALTAMGPLHSRINTRTFVSTSGYSDGTALAQKDLGDIIVTMLNIVNASVYTGVAVGTITPSIDGFLEKIYANKLGEVWISLSQQLGGPDLELAPVEPVAVAGGTKIAELNIAPAFGQAQANAIFEYGTGKRNIASYRRPFDRQGQATRLNHLAPGFPDSVEAGVPPLLTVTSAAAEAVWGRLEDVVQADIQPAIMRQLLLNEHLRIRKNPRETFFFTPAADADVAWGTHYALGDLVEARVVSGGKSRFDGQLRIFGVHFTVTELGQESVELTLINEATQT